MPGKVLRDLGFLPEGRLTLSDFNDPFCGAIHGPATPPRSPAPGTELLNSELAVVRQLPFDSNRISVAGGTS